MSVRRHGQEPTFPLCRIQELVRSPGGYRITQSAFEGAEDICWDEDDILSCVCELRDEHFEQSYESRKRPGTYQDVYKIRFRGFRLFLKLQLVGDRLAVIISFKRDTSP
jgi:hypothetical protein